MRVSFSTTVKALREITDVLKLIDNDNTHFIVNGDSLVVKVVDKSHVSLMRIDIPSWGLHSYEAVDVPIEDPRFMVSVSVLNESLKGHKPTDEVTCNVDTLVGSCVVEVGDLARTIGLFGEDSAILPRFPDLDFENKGVVFTTTSEWLENAVKHCSDVRDIMTMDFHDGSLKTSAKDAYNEASLQTEVLWDGINMDEIQSKYSTKFLKPLTRKARMVSAKGDLRVKIGPKYPISIEWTAPSCGAEYLYLLAPRIGEV